MPTDSLRDAPGTGVMNPPSPGWVERMVRERDSFYRMLFENHHVMMLVLDPDDGRIHDANPAACAFYGWPRDRMRAMRIHEINTLDDASIHGALQRTSTDKVARFRFRHRLADGTARDVDVSSGIVQIDGRELLFSIITDITEQLRTERALQEAKSEAERANRAKSDFLAAMSHEIRTPLHGVIGFVDLLAGTELGPRQLEFLGNARSSARTLLATIDDILDFSKIEAGKVEIERVPVDLDTLVREALATVRFQAGRKNVALESARDAGAPGWILSDPARIRQILVNLLGNAVKFTDSGRVSVGIGWEPPAVEAGAGIVRLHVRDTGTGIPPERIAGMFDEFVQADASIARLRGGTGLGLAISRRFARLMDGDIEVESRIGEGSVFTLVVRAEAIGTGVGRGALRDGADALRDALRSFEGRPPRILVGEDHPINRTLLSAMLSNLLPGCEVVEAEDGAAAVDEAGRVDLAILDLQMPGMDGCTATRRIRASEGASAHLPIVAFSASSFAHEREGALAAGMDEFLSKPTGLAELAAMLARRLRPASSAGDVSRARS